MDDTLIIWSLIEPSSIPSGFEQAGSKLQREQGKVTKSIHPIKKKSLHVLKSSFMMTIVRILVNQCLTRAI